MLPTPDTSHVSFDNVYEPAEDSFLLLDTLASAHETTFLNDRFGARPASQLNTNGLTNAKSSSPLVLEVGSGSGVVLAFVAANASTIFGRRDVLTMGIDVNEFACRATARTVVTNVTTASGLPLSTFLDSITGSLTTCVRPHTVDMLIFNPPYVPSEEVPLTPAVMAAGDNLQSRSDIFERDNKLLALATDGGIDGMQITWLLLEALPAILSDRGVAYILLCAQNRPEEVKSKIKDWSKAGTRNAWDVQTVGSSGRTAGWEKLQIIRISRIAQV